MEKFKVGDKVFKARIYSKEKYCKFGGSAEEVPIKTKGVVTNVTENQVMVCFENNIDWDVDVSEIDLVKKGEKLKPEDLIRYMAYGDGGNNKSNLYTSEKEMSEYVRQVARDSSWIGEIIGYKLIPIFKVEKKTILKKYNLTKKRAKK